MQAGMKLRVAFRNFAKVPNKLFLPFRNCLAKLMRKFKTTVIWDVTPWSLVDMFRRRGLDRTVTSPNHRKNSDNYMYHLLKNLRTLNYADAVWVQMFRVIFRTNSKYFTQQN